MPFELVVDHKKKLITRTVTGEFDDAQAAAARSAFQAIPESAHYDELYDYLGVTEYRISSELVRRYAIESLAREDAKTPGKRVAFVAKKDATWGVLRMYNTYLEGTSENIRFFEDLASAHVWLEDGR